jgi:hypothetical protein
VKNARNRKEEGNVEVGLPRFLRVSRIFGVCISSTLVFFKLLPFFAFFTYFRYLKEELKYLGILGVIGLIIAVLGLLGLIKV